MIFEKYVPLKAPSELPLGSGGAFLIAVYKQIL
jgi:hypothetical protein